MTALSRIIRQVLAATEKAISSGGARYEPAEHYMRGPGPKCRAKDRSCAG